MDHAARACPSVKEWGRKVGTEPKTQYEDQQDLGGEGIWSNCTAVLRAKGERFMRRHDWRIVNIVRIANHS